MCVYENIYSNPIQMRKGWQLRNMRREGTMVRQEQGQQTQITKNIADTQTHAHTRETLSWGCEGGERFSEWECYEENN